jgi:hypothetical protein
MNLAEKMYTLFNYSKVSEKIVFALKSVNCQVNINPVQIQGLDMQPIYQLLQWLVKKLLESRDERNTINKQIALEYFNTNLGEVKPLSMLIYEMQTHTKYNYTNTGRLFRRMQDSKLDYNEPLRIYFTLAEYGMNKDLSFQRTMIDLLKKKNLIEEKSDSTGDRLASGNTTNITNEEKNKLDEVLQTNVKEVSGLNKLNINIIEEIFSENVQTIINEIDK